MDASHHPCGGIPSRLPGGGGAPRPDARGWPKGCPSTVARERIRVPEATRRVKPAAACIVRHNYYPDTHVRRDAEALVEAGYDVSVVSLRRPGQAAREALCGVNVYRLPMQHRRGSSLRYAWEYTLFLFLAFLTVTALHVKKRFRVVEVDNMPDILVLSALVPRLLGVRVILYVFDNMPELLAYLRGWSARHPVVRFLAFLERLSARFADRVIVTQEMPRRAMASRGVPRHKIAVVLNSADETAFVPSAAPDAGRRDVFQIVSHGVILERYGVQVLIEALPSIAAQVPGVEVQVFGEGEYRRALEEQARRNGTTQLVSFRGFAPFDELIATLARADVGYVGMLNDLVLPNKLMEYVALGVPVTASRWPTFLHYFPDEAVAYFRPGDPEDLAAAIVRMHRNPASSRARARRAKELYQDYRWSVQREVYLGVYSELLNGVVGASAMGSRVGAAPYQRS
ncbi:MAG: glycosyltransferase [Chloroflexi bacterium]|nr:glycosyltransferase [Chloroflexota bacterium]